MPTDFANPPELGVDAPRGWPALISVVVPCYNEEAVVNVLHARLCAVLDALPARYEIVFVNDGSRDGTLRNLLELAHLHTNLRIVDFTRNFGHQVAVSAGLEYAVGDVVVLIDADLQDPPDLIPDMLAKWREGYDVVYAVRQTRNGESWFKKFTAHAFYKAVARMTDVSIPVDTGDFRLISRSVVDDLLKIRERHRFIRGLVSWVGYNQVGIPYHRDRRYAGESKYPLRKMLVFAFDGITSFSIKPLQWAGYAGFVAAFLGLVGLVWVLAVHFATDAALHGWTSLMVGVLFLGGVQLLVLGVLGEYVGRIYDEVRQRPLYLVRRVYGAHLEEPLRIGDCSRPQ